MKENLRKEIKEKRSEQTKEEISKYNTIKMFLVYCANELLIVQNCTINN